MRNLKRVLSLGLASVMLIGMMVMGAGAADKTYKDLTDKDKIENKEAVSLLVDLGIVQGKTDGSYDPTGIVDKATMAKFITYIMMGDVDQGNFTGTTTTLKDINGNWAEGYIKYCAANGIVTGDNNGNFSPSKEVTTVEAAKMLLVALGYDPSAQGYTNNANWSANIMRDAQKAGLTNNMSVKATAGLSRDNAAQIVYNALLANTVTNEYTYDQGKQYVSRVTNNATTLGLETYGLVKISGKVTAADEKTTTIDTGLKGINSRRFDIAVPGSLGKTVTLYAKYTYTVKDGEITYNTLKEIYSSEGIVVDSANLGVSTDGTKLTDLTNTKKTAYISGLDVADAEGKGGVVYYYNGDPLNVYKDLATAFADLKKAGNAIVAGEPVNVTAADKSTNLLGNGVSVTFVDNDSNGKADVVDIVAYTPAKVTSYSTSGDGSVTFSKSMGPDSVSKWDAEDVIGFNSLTKGDFVTLTYANGKVTAVVAKTAEGSVSSAKSDGSSISLDGTAYKPAKTVTGEVDMKVGDDVTLYLDAYGYYFAKEGTTSTDVTAYVYVVQSSDANKLDNSRAKLIFSDGTSSTVTVGKLDGNTLPYTPEGKEEKDAIKAPAPGIYTYTEKDGKYNLSSVTNKNTLTGEAKYTAEKNVATITNGNSTDYANTNTVFVDIENGKSYTGYKNLPSKIDFKTGYMVFDGATATKGLMKLVFMSGAKAENTSNDQLVVFKTVGDESSVNGETVYTLSAILNGELKDVVLDKTTFNALKGTGVGVYGVKSMDTDGTITGLDTKIGFDTAKKVTVFSGGTLVADTAWTVDDETIYVKINVGDKKGEVVDSDSVSADTDNESMVIVTKVGSSGADQTTAKYVYVITNVPVTK